MPLRNEEIKHTYVLFKKSCFENKNESFNSYYLKDYPQHIKEEENKNLTGGLKGRPPGNYVGVSYDPTPVRINPNNVGVSFDQTPVQNCAVDAYDQQQIRRNPNNAGFSYDPTPVRLSQNVAYDYEPQNYQITPTTLVSLFKFFA